MTTKVKPKNPNLLERFQKFYLSLSEEDQRRMYYIMSGMRGPDYEISTDIHSSEKELTTAKLRALVIPCSSDCLLLGGKKQRKEGISFHEFGYQVNYSKKELTAVEEAYLKNASCEKSKRHFFRHQRDAFVALSSMISKNDRAFFETPNILNANDKLWLLSK